MDVAAIKAKADELQRTNKWKEAYEYLEPYADEATDPEVLWRVIRSFYRMGKYLARNNEERDQIARKAQQVSERALQQHENNYNVQKVSRVFSLSIIVMAVDVLSVVWNSAELDK